MMKVLAVLLFVLALTVSCGTGYLLASNLGLLGVPIAFFAGYGIGIATAPLVVRLWSCPSDRPLRD